ncbi:MAG: NAD-dependent epimerase/dehydratase family protein [Streptosporangiales bacterium]|nr:NAD-dependent epimerase/dehydratase family protein [Streptosporangiales bacterium]
MNGTLLITGGAGFVGQAVAAAALDHGYAPVLVDVHEPRRLRPELTEVPRHTLDLTDATAVTETAQRIRPRAIVHLAAYGEGGAGLASGASQRPDRAAHVNVCGFVHAVQAAAAVGCRVVWSSSTTVYGPPEQYAGDVDETAPVHPASVYGASKVACEELGRVLAAQLSVETTALRLPLVYGPGRWYGGSQQSLVRFVADLVADEPARIEAWTDVADWMHVDDAASAVLAAVAVAEPHQVYNVTGHRGSLAELATELAAAAGAVADVAAGTVAGVRLPLLDTRRAERHLAFRPRYADAAMGAAHYLHTERQR